MWHQQIHEKLCDLLKQLDVKIIYTTLTPKIKGNSQCIFYI